MPENPVIVNVGCGASPTDGAVNLDNSFSVTLGRHLGIVRFLRKIHLISQDQMDYAVFCSEHGIVRASCFSLPFSDHSVDVVYTSHMMEHLPKEKLPELFREVLRVLKQDGFFRIALPDMRIMVEKYLKDGDCDALIEAELLSPQTGTFAERIRLLLFGFRGHHWMYDAASFEKLLRKSGFGNIVKLPQGETTIPFPTKIDLSERADESFYLECRPPKGEKGETDK